MAENSKIEKKHKGMFFELDYGKDIKIDLKDKKILAILGENCRAQVGYIGDLVGLGKDSVRYRINELIKKDLYRQNLCIFNPFVLGVGFHTFLLKLEKITPEKEEEIIDYFAEHPFVIWVGHTQGAYDFNIPFLAMDIKHLDKLAKEVRAKLMGYLKDIKILNHTNMFCCNTIPITFRKDLDFEIKFNKLDTSFGSLMKEIPYCSVNEEKVKLDHTDFLIISTIANNANMTLQEISKETGVKADTVKNRIMNMIKKNVIIAFRSSINDSYLKFHGYVSYWRLLPNVTDEQRKRFEDFFRFNEATAFGLECSGSAYDLEVYIYAKDPLDFNRIINEVRHKFANIIEEYETVLILKDYKFTFLPKGVIGPLKKFLLKVITKFSS